MASEPAVGVEKRLYLQRLKELDADIARGAITADAAIEAKVELDRQFLTNVENSDGINSPGGKVAMTVLGSIAVFAIAGALGLYSMIGAPDLHGQSLQVAAPIQTGQDDIEEAIAKVEQRLAEQPDDVRGWQVLEPIYRRLGENQKAVTAMRHIIRLSGPTLDSQSELAELLLLVGLEPGRNEAKKILADLKTSAPDAVRPRFMLAIIAMQENKYSDAADLWRDLLVDASDKDEPWVEIARQGLEQAESASEPSSVDTALAGPTNDDISAAGEMSSQDRAEMINNMVETLLQRLQNDGGTLAEWQQLLRAQMVLGRNDEAALSLVSAVKNLEVQADQEIMKKFAADLGIVALTE